MNDEFLKNDFNKIINNDKKIIINLTNTKTNSQKTYSFNFETNLIYNIPDSTIKFTITSYNNNENNILFFVNNVIYGVYKEDSSANRAYYEGLTDKYNFVNYIYYPDQFLKIHLQGDYYMEVSIINNSQINTSEEKKELLRVQYRTNDFYLILPPKRDFVFFKDRLEIYKKNNLKRIIKYSDIIEISVLKTWQNNMFINCKPIGVMLYRISDNDISRIKEIIRK